jgi:hypothetical protein
MEGEMRKEEERNCERHKEIYKRRGKRRRKILRYSIDGAITVLKPHHIAVIRV